MEFHQTEFCFINFNLINQKFNNNNNDDDDDDNNNNLITNYVINNCDKI